MNRLSNASIVCIVLAAFLSAPHASLVHAKASAVPTKPLPTTAQINAYLVRAHFHGYVYLERHGHVILSQGYGMADAKDKRPTTLQTKWPAFAETRFLIGLAIMRLQDERKLSVGTTFCHYVSGCPVGWHGITIDQLLTNTSGIDSYNPFAPGATIPRTTAGCKVTLLVAKPGGFSPWSDCNTFLLGTILERVTGKTWAGAMQQLVFGPAGATNSGRMTNALVPPQRGQLYRRGVGTPPLDYAGYNLAYTTAADMIRLNLALLAGKLVSQRALTTMFTSRLRDNPGDPHAAVWRGYEVVMFPQTAGTYKVVCVSCVNGGGEDETGDGAGFFMTVEVSPQAGSLQIEVNNDSGLFDPGNADNKFFAFISKRLYGR